MLDKAKPKSAVNDDIGEETRLRLFETQVVIREAEQRAYDLFLQNLVKGTSHLSLADHERSEITDLGQSCNGRVGLRADAQRDAYTSRKLASNPRTTSVNWASVPSAPLFFMVAITSAQPLRVLRRLVVVSAS